MGRIVILNNVSEVNNNKVYRMEENPDGSSWTAKWGRIGGSSLSSQVYPLSDWDKKYKEKIKKGYEDVTDLMSVEKDTSDSIDVQYSSNPLVQELVTYLQSCAKSAIKKNYTVRVADVTEKQLAAAQVILNTLAVHSSQSSNLFDFQVSSINSELLQLYKIIPRKMSDTRKYLLQGPDIAKFNELLSAEQDLLDTLKTQVQVPATSSGSTQQDLVSFGLSIAPATQADKDRIKATTDFALGSHKVFVVDNMKTRSAFNTIPDTSNIKLLFHGSRNENWWSILNQGLLIRPTNAAHTGSMFGDGVYGANKAKKSIGYTSLRGSYWAGGSSNRAYLALYEFNLGREWNIVGPGKKYESWMSRINISRVRQEQCDSVYARGGADLINDEYIIYEPNRCTIKYLIELS